MGKKMRAKKEDKSGNQREETIELEKDEQEIQKVKKKKDKIVDGDREADKVAEALETTCVEGEENISENTNRSKDFVNSVEDKKEKKKKHKEEEEKKKRNEGVDGISSLGENIEDDKVNELVEGQRQNKNCHEGPVVNSEEEQAEKKKKKKKKKEEEEGVDGISSLGENFEGEKMDELVKEFGYRKSQGNPGVNSLVEQGEKKEKKKKKKKEGADGTSSLGENVGDDNMDELVKGQRNNKNFQDIHAVNSEVERTEKKKKRKRENEDGDDMVKNIVSNVQKLSKEEKHTDSKVNEGSKLAAKDEMGEVAKAQMGTESRDVAEMNNDKEGDNGKKRKKKRKIENASGDVEETIVDKLGSESTRIQDNEKVGYEDVCSTENTLLEGFSNAVHTNDVDEGKKKAKSAKLGKGDDCSKDKKKKVKVEKHVSDGKGQKQKPRTKKDSETTNTSENPTPRGKSKRVSFSDDVEVFSSDGPSWRNSKQAEGLVRGKRFTLEEDEKVKEAVLGYIEERGLGDEGLDMVLNCKSYPEVKNCWKAIAASIPWRPVDSVYYRAHILFERDENQKWTPEEYEYILKFYKENGSDWKKLSKELNKHRFHVKDAYRRVKYTSLSKGRWSQEEYQNLFDLVNMDLRMRASEEKKTKHGMLRDNICWGAISERLSSRHHVACCSKWYKQLTSSMVAEGFWSDTDDYRLLDALSDLDAACIEDVNWDNLLEHREGEICRKRWNQMVKHIGDYANKSFSEQVEVLSKRYSVDVLDSKEIYDSKEPVDVKSKKKRTS